MSRLCSSRFERAARKLGWTRIAGIDEAGRGALLGPVVAAAVILNPKRRIARLDAWNIYQASRQAMTAALQQLSVVPDYLLIDAMQLDILIEQKSLIKGDARSVSIAAASILAKTHRDT